MCARVGVCIPKLKCSCLLEQEKAYGEEKPGTEKKKQTSNSKLFGYHQLHASSMLWIVQLRRKFKEADNAQSKNSEKTLKDKWALYHIQKLYRIEETIKSLSVEERYNIRQEKAVPLLEQFKT